VKVVEHLARATRPLISFEIIPPLRGGTLQRLLELIEGLQRFAPPFIDITSHSAEAAYDEQRDGTVVRRVRRKRPGTLGVCALIQNKYRIDTVPHVLCHGFTREETEDVLIEMRYLGIENVLAVRGDDTGFAKPVRADRSVNRYASELVEQIVHMNHGKYLDEELLDADPTSFCIGVGGYPEKHFEAPNLATDIHYTKKKVDAGAEYIVTQMFFDNDDYFAYVDRCRAAGITVPIIPGLKILTTRGQVTSLPRTFFISLPDALTQEALAADPKHVADIGVDWAVRQAENLLSRGVSSLHFYIMQSSEAITKVLDRLKL
jgi:methylenetetrahydrofolate reductase (NADPH)